MWTKKPSVWVHTLNRNGWTTRRTFNGIYIFLACIIYILHAFRDMIIVFGFLPYCVAWICAIAVGVAIAYFYSLSLSVMHLFISTFCRMILSFCLFVVCECIILANAIWMRSIRKTNDHGSQMYLLILGIQTLVRSCIKWKKQRNISSSLNPCIWLINKVIPSFTLLSRLLFFDEHMKWMVMIWYPKKDSTKRRAHACRYSAGMIVRIFISMKTYLIRISCAAFA